MPPKKAVKEEQRPLLGRVSENLKMGVVGLPNVGKSTFFNAITNSAVRAENFPFCTIDPEESRCAVPDVRFDWLRDTFKPNSKVPAYLRIIDIAGLVKGASSGEGLGNAFLSHIKAVDGIFHLVRAFDAEEIAHVEGELDPIRDMEIIREELRLKDVEFAAKHLDIAKKGLRGAENDKNKKSELEAMQKVHDWLVNEKKEVRFGDWNGREIEVLNTMQLLTAKSVVFLVNVSEEDYLKKKNKWLAKIKTWIDANSAGDTLIPFCGEFETRLAKMSIEERDAELKRLQAASALPKIIVTGYSTLQLVYFFTSGPDEVRAWTIRRNTKAPQAAGVIHSDFERGFIMAEVMKYDDLKALGSEAAVRAAGKYYQKGRDYVVEDGDIIFFKFNVSSAKKK